MVCCLPAPCLPGWFPPSNSRRHTWVMTRPPGTTPCPCPACGGGRPAAAAACAALAAATAAAAAAASWSSAVPAAPAGGAPGRCGGLAWSVSKKVRMEELAASKVGWTTSAPRTLQGARRGGVGCGCFGGQVYSGVGGVVCHFRGPFCWA